MSPTAPPGTALARPFADVGLRSQQPHEPPVALPQLADAVPEPAAREAAGAAAARVAAQATGRDTSSGAPVDRPTAGEAPSLPAAAASAQAAPATAVLTTTSATMPVGVAAPTKPAIGTAHPGTPQATPSQPANAGSLGGAVLALFLVIGLILALAWLARRMPGLGGARGNASLRIVGSLALGPRERVVVVAVGETQLLLGVGAGGTRTLHTLSEPLPVAAAVPPSPAFAQLLAQHFGKKP